MYDKRWDVLFSYYLPSSPRTPILIQPDWWQREVVSYLSGYVPSLFLDDFRYVHQLLPGVYLCTQQKTHSHSITAITQTVSFMHALSTKPKRIRVFLLPNRVPKRLPAEERPLTSLDIHSGVCIKKNRVYVWREEELLKVLIHEFVHAYSMDCKEPCKAFGQIVRMLYPLEMTLRRNPHPKEAVTDALAIVIYAYLQSKWKGTKNPHNILTLQTTWAVAQSEKIEGHLRRTCGVLDADVYAYYVLKAWLLVAACVQPDVYGKLLLQHTSLHRSPPSSREPPGRIERLFTWGEDVQIKFNHLRGTTNTKTLRMSL